MTVGKYERIFFKLILQTWKSKIGRKKGKRKKSALLINLISSVIKILSLSKQLIKEYIKENLMRKIYNKRYLIRTFKLHVLFICNLVLRAFSLIHC